MVENPPTMQETPVPWVREIDAPGGGNSCLENSTVSGAWRAAVHGVAKSRIRLSN